MPKTGADEVNPTGVQTSGASIGGHEFLDPPGGAVPTAAAGAALGSAPPAVLVLAGSDDNRGQVTFGSGTSPTTGIAVTVTFAKAYATAPESVGVTDTTLGGAVTDAGLGLFVSSVTTTTFVVSVTTAPTASQANTIYGFEYDVIQ